MSYFLPKVRLDFETRSECDIKKHGASVYARHPSTEILCLQSHITGDRNCRLWVPDPFTYTGITIPDYLLDAVEGEYTFEAHNSFFEQLIWIHICVKRFDWLQIPIERWSCTQALAASYSLPQSLDNAARALGLSETKDAEGSRIMLKLSKPRKPSKNNSDKYFSSKEDFEKLYSYGEQDVITQKGISKRLRPLAGYMRRVWEMDQRINHRGIYADRKAIQGALKIIDELTPKYNSRMFELTGGYVNTVNQTAKIREALNDLGINVSGVGKPVLEQALIDYPDMDPIAKEIIDLRLTAAKSSTRKLEAMLNRMDDDDRIRQLILFHGAHTGRWTGSGIQIHNFPRGTIKDRSEIQFVLSILEQGDTERLSLLYSNPLETISSCLRAMLQAAPGHELFGADYSGIEARFLMWLCDEFSAIDMFRNGMDIYKDLASKIFQKNLSDISDQERQLGKRGILGSGYQMGPPRFRDTCAGYGLIIPLVMAEKTIRTYRKTYKKVVRFWRDIEACAIDAVRSPGKRIPCGKVSCQTRDGFLFIKLPSSRELAYYDPQIKHDDRFDKPKLTYLGVHPKTKKWVRLSTYGGSLTENIVQGACFDIMAQAMLRLEEKDYPVVLTVHDEIVSEVWKGTKRLEDFKLIMASDVKWAPGLPLKVEGWQGKEFRK